MSAVTFILSVKSLLEVSISSLLSFKDKTIYKKCIGRKHILSLWDKWLYEKWICIIYRYITRIFEYSSVFVGRKCGRKRVLFSATAVLFIMLSIGKSWHCSITACAVAFDLSRLDLEEFSSLLDTYARAALQWELMGIASCERRRVDPNHWIVH